MIAPSLVAEAVARVRQRIDDAGGRHVRLVAVTKGFGPEALTAAVQAGADACGESYAQELLAKVEPLGLAPDAAGRHHDRPLWQQGVTGEAPVVHFIGNLQRRKVRQVAPFVSLWQSIDRLELGRELAARAPGARLLVQLNLSGEAHKGGCPPEEAAALVAALRDLGLDVRGLMGVGPAGPPELARPGFARLVALADELGLPERSIGMSGDLEVAVEEGSTMVRVGSDLFGPRPGRAPGVEVDGPTP